MYRLVGEEMPEMYFFCADGDSSPEYCCSSVNLLVCVFFFVLNRPFYSCVLSCLALKPCQD